MKAISIKQPWASLIAAGIKDVENRYWKTKFRGRVFIHASAKPAVKAGNTWTIYSKEQHDLIHMQHDHLVLKSEFETSRIIGEVDIIDCVINHPSIWAEKSGIPNMKKPNRQSYFYQNEFGHDVIDERSFQDHMRQYHAMKPIYNWVLANPVMYDEPILNVKGKLSFWDYER